MFNINILIVSIGLLFCTFTPRVFALNVDDTRHLLTRVGFSPAAHEFKPFEKLSRQQAINTLIDGLRVEAITPAPSLMFEQFYQANPSSFPVASGCTLLNTEITNNTPHDIYSRRYAEHYSMKRWWWTEMINTSSPLTERLTLLWHDHFATGFGVWAIPQYYNNQTLRLLGSSNFKTLATAMLRDPAMIYYLDNYKNINSRPNENLAREFLELFTMGEGNYSQQDITALAKVLAGHGLSEEDCQYKFDEGQAYKGEVTLFGQQGDFSIEQAVDIIFEDPKVSEFIVKRFWIEFISPTFTDEQIKPLAKQFKEHNYDIRFLLNQVFIHEAFWAKENRGSLVKSPVELLVGMIRSFGVWMPDPDLLIGDSRAMGHDLFSPPNVAGWHENSGWINPLTVVLRSLAVDRVWRADANIKQLRHDYTDLEGGLIIRTSSQQHPRLEPRSFYVYVNDNLVKHFTLTMGDKEDKKNALAVIQEPETLYIPASQLPDDIRTVKIDYKFDNSLYAGLGYPQLLVHWLEYQGLRYNVNLAKQVLTDTTNNMTPVGMLVKSGSLIFDLENIRKHHLKIAKDDRVFMTYNTNTPIIDELYSFGQEQPMPLLPAGLDLNSLPLDAARGFKALAKVSDFKVGDVPVLAILPKLTALKETKLVTANPLQALAHSSYYQLK